MFRRKQKKFSKKTEREKKSLIKNQIPGKDCMIDNAKLNILPEVVPRFEITLITYLSLNKSSAPKCPTKASKCKYSSLEEGSHYSNPDDGTSK